ncbi:hypothetical protein [Moraxella sp. VT-16-12]|uniref:hypothetical protein n=1 Tax=Moraxella sp. VT-16-12 TaxID=2014877 RepID=UPI000B7C9C0A|nr:hypothetical protein [Moraxella sp. VT-16-12]TWV80938.1 hypothetical protein CEW93_009060 [Moraxella sp. VT-16-12]
MKKLLTIFTLVMGIQCANAQDVAHLGEPAVLTGKIMMIKSLIDEPPYNESNYPAITLDKTLTVTGYDDFDEYKHINTKLIQLADNNSGIQYSRSNGKRIRVKCSELFGEHSAWHNTKVLCLVDNAKIIR